MPSPVAHSLIGFAVAAYFAVKPGRPPEICESLRQKAGWLFSGVALANLPDVDYLPGAWSGDINAYHHFYTHSLGWVMLAACAWWLVWKIICARVGWREFAFVGLALSSHLIADVATADARPPFGIMAFWPISDRYFFSPVTIFWRLHKRSWSEVVQWHNVWAVSVEVAICLPIVLLVLFLKMRARPETKQASRAGGTPVSYII